MVLIIYPDEGAGASTAFKIRSPKSEARQEARSPEGRGPKTPRPLPDVALGRRISDFLSDLGLRASGCLSGVVTRIMPRSRCHAVLLSRLPYGTAPSPLLPGRRGGVELLARGPAPAHRSTRVESRGQGGRSGPGRRRARTLPAS